MDCCRKMDAPRFTRIRWSLIRFSLVVLCFANLAAGQTSDSPTQRAEQLAAKQQWQEIVSLAENTPARSPDLNYLYGTALAHLERWPRAHAAFREGELKPQRLAGLGDFGVGIEEPVRPV